MADRFYSNPSPPPGYDPKKGIAVKAEKKKSEAAVTTAPVKNEKVKSEPGDYDEDKPSPLSRFMDEQAFGAAERDYYCEVCKSSMNSTHAFYTHMIGKRHKKKLNAVNYTAPSAVKREMRPNISTVPIKTIGGPIVASLRYLHSRPQIQHKIDRHVGPPIIGLSFISEIHLSKGVEVPVYYCRLCAAECQMLTIIDHAIGFRHRMAYMKLVDFALYRSISNSTRKKRHLSEKVEKFAQDMERKDGRGQMMVQMQIEPDEHGNIEEPVEKPASRLPTSMQKAMMKQVGAADATKDLQMFQSSSQALAEASTLSDQQVRQIFEMKERFEKIYMEARIDHAFSEMPQSVSEDLLTQNYQSALEKVFLMDNNEFGHLSKPVICDLINDSKQQ